MSKLVVLGRGWAIVQNLVMLAPRPQKILGALINSLASRRDKDHELENDLGHLPGRRFFRKRPRRATKETWKATEAREELEVKWSQASSESHQKKRALSHGLHRGKEKEDNRVAEIEVIHLEEDGSI
jgi:hypothetical protein